MAYVKLLKDSPFSQYFPAQLIEHLYGETLDDASVQYRLPEITTDIQNYKKKKRFQTKPTDVRIPARLNSPLIPYPQELKDFSNNKPLSEPDIIHGHHTSQIDSINSVFAELLKLNKIPDAKLVFSIDELKKFARQSYSSREKLINLSTLAFAKRATMHDLSIAATTNVPFQASPSNLSQYTSFIIMVQRLRVHIAKESTFPSFIATDAITTSLEANYKMYSNGVYIYYSTHPDHTFYLISCGGHFRIYHKNLNVWFCGPTSYFDYVFTISDILNNIDILRNCEEYAWALDMFKIMIEFAEYEGFHKEQVDFMKGMEGFLLNMSDYDENYAMNWKPLLEIIFDLWELDKKISGINYDLGLILALLHGGNFKCPQNSFLCKFITCGLKMSRTHLQEISALHKLIFYAEVNAEAGVMKFLKRVHTKREFDENAVKNITRFAKQHFLIAYKKKHGTIPNCIGPVDKVKLLESYCNRQSYDRVEALPLSWWDDIKLFDCMDNTLTDDPLEFAKDKGALKSEISFGPGDSRKELLQVIEKQDYQLKDFFESKTIIPKERKVQRTTQKENPVKMKDPARLIEKEREQKYEARLFGNAELENKHSLSLVAARMKKALSYFDEQLMTPTDKKRKALIHEASRELSFEHNYSLLLDIEGHNQSMQHGNTHELAEFLGNLFGYDGWGDISHYFSQLTVYHYDEYLDKVIESEGQYGGIEGWMNPFWTLHTLIMMKLLRYMTDITVKTIMVYSDDVNAIIQIKQPSEPMVKSIFSKIMKHCTKFGMTVKYSQTTLSKHRITMLRQHYADGIRADSTLKRLISVSAGNNPMIVSDELEIAGICSSASSAMELSNHHEACAYLKNYKIGLLLCRLPQMILSKIHDDSMISPEELPAKLSNLIYYSKDDKSQLNLLNNTSLFMAAKNDIAAYLQRNPRSMSDDIFKISLKAIYGQGVAENRLVDSPDRIMYLQIYDDFLQDLLFFWAYLPSSLGGLGGALHLNLMLSGHSVGLSKSLHYLHVWAKNYSSNSEFFLKYINVALSVDMENKRNLLESRLVTLTWPGDDNICPATTSIKQSIRSMVQRKTKNRRVLELFKMADDREVIANGVLEIFRNNFHTRLVQFYHENTSIHFLDLLISKVETSSGLLSYVKNITRLRNSLCSRVIENIRNVSVTSKTIFSEMTKDTDVIDYLFKRKALMFPKIKFIEVEEILYDDKIIEVDTYNALLTVRRCAPTHYRNGLKVFDDPKVGNETLYKGDLIDDDRMLGNKEELLAAKLVAVTKWLLMKHNLLALEKTEVLRLDCVKACNLSLSTLTNQSFFDLFLYAPTETGGEILHRIPNMRFSTATYIRSEMNRSLNYTTELNQQTISNLGLVDSNVNFDYLRMRYLVAAITMDKYDSMRRLVIRYGFNKLTGIKDVQFVTPKPTEWSESINLTCYSEACNHDLSKLRFRYLSHSYLYEENVSEWSLIPKLKELETSEEIGINYVNDIILRYSRDLDKDYMMVSPTNIDEHLWTPLINKLYKIDKHWKKNSANSDEEEIAERLAKVMNERSRITTVNRTNAISLGLQTKCLEAIADSCPDDTEYHELVSRYSKTVQRGKYSMRLSVRLARYQNLLANLEEHKRNLAKHLLFEYLTTFHFKIRDDNGLISLDTEASFRECMSNGLGKLSMMIISPDLQVRIIVLGVEYVESLLIQKPYEILDEYRDLCSSITLADVIIPSSLPSLETHTRLNGHESIPAYLHEIEYASQDIPYSAMEELHHLSPLCKYAQMCSTTGADPRTFTSPTGSDSLGAQLGLFRMMKSQNVIDETTMICDLTAGRGDGLYAANALNLNCSSFSILDTFTRIDHHPQISFKTDYDVFDGSTLKFVTGFDFVHVDISFTGGKKTNVLDLILMLESNNLAYSIRLNSVSCEGYVKSLTSSLPRFKHRLAYAMNSSLKPYQIYLIGVPWVGNIPDQSVSLKDTIAFRSIAISFSHLLSPKNYNLRLVNFEPNSASIYLPKESHLDDFISSICTDSIESEQLYYCKRYLAEIGDDATIEFSFNHLDEHGKNLMSNNTNIVTVDIESSYDRLTEDMIGNVSVKSFPFHRSHIEAIREKSTPIWKLPILSCDESVLTYFRIHHPIQEIRSWCNIVLGLHKFCRSQLLSGHKSIEEFHQSITSRSPPKTSMHQREIFMAIKLLVLAARDDDYSYGMKYCHKILSQGTKSTQSVSRTLKIYRLLSFLFDTIQLAMQRGGICIRSILAIANDLEVREQRRYRYKRKQSEEIITQADKEMFENIINDSIDNLFAGLESYASSLVVESDTENHNDLFKPHMEELNLKFDLNINEHVDNMIAKLGLKPSGPHGIIDLGDDIYPEDDDW
jgi:hypothetical protein